MDKKAENKRRLKEWLISLAVTLVLLGLVLGAQYWYTTTTRIELDMTAVWIGHAVGGVLMLFLVHHFVKKPRDDREPTFD